MNYVSTPTVFEIIENDTKDLAAKIEMFDECCASINLHGVHNVHSFMQLVPKIVDCLKQMSLVGDDISVL